MLSRIMIAPLLLASFGLPASADDASESTTVRSNVVTPQTNQVDALIQIAILLDTSGSMKGLADQARCQLWNVVSELAMASRGDTPSNLEIAVYQYGTDQVSKSRGCLRQVTGFTSDLDEVSRALFSLKIGGGDEYCGEVINTAIDQLNWNPSNNAYKAVFVAGNESFDQGKVGFGNALTKALSDSIVLNSIYCFDRKYSEATKGMDQWEIAANLAEGMYFQIDHNHHLPKVMTPYDARMRELNDQMNETFVWYGKNAKRAQKNQAQQDRNAEKMSDDAFASRMSAKIGHLYHHVHDDLVDAVSHGVVRLDRMPESIMPEELKAMEPESRQKFIEQRVAKRNHVRRMMAEVISQRHAYLQRAMPESIGQAANAPKVLGDALIEAVRSQAIHRGFQFRDAKTQLAVQAR